MSDPTKKNYYPVSKERVNELKTQLMDLVCEAYREGVILTAEVNSYKAAPAMGHYYISLGARPRRIVKE